MEQLLVEPWQRVSISAPATNSRRCHADGSRQEYQVSQGKIVSSFLLEVTLKSKGTQLDVTQTDQDKISMSCLLITVTLKDKVSMSRLFVDVTPTT